MSDDLAIWQRSIRARLEMLKEELDTGHTELRRVRAGQKYLREKLLRIEGAVKVLEELLREPIGSISTAPLSSRHREARGAYVQRWLANRPGCLIVLFDQSGSMSEPFAGSQIGAGKAKSEMVATVLNRIVEDFIQASTKGMEISPQADVALLGYSGDSVVSALPLELSRTDFVTLPELRENPREVKLVKRKAMDPTGAVYDEDVYVNVWVEPVANGRAPMGKAFEEARRRAEGWASSHPDNYPPVVVNVSSGQATDVTDPELVRLAGGIMSVSTIDGHALLYNCHITDRSDPPVEFPVFEADIPRDKFARLLFQISSELPDTARDAFRAVTSRDLVPGARGYSFNSDVSWRNLVPLGTLF